MRRARCTSLALAAAFSLSGCAVAARNDCAALPQDIARIRAAKFATKMDQWNVVVRGLTCGAECPDVFRSTIRQLPPADPHAVLGRQDAYRPGAVWTDGEMLLALARVGLGARGDLDDCDGEFTTQVQDELETLLAAPANSAPVTAAAPSAGAVRTPCARMIREPKAQGPADDSAVNHRVLEFN